MYLNIYFLPSILIQQIFPKSSLMYRWYCLNKTAMYLELFSYLDLKSESDKTNLQARELNQNKSRKKENQLFALAHLKMSARARTTFTFQAHRDKG